MRYTQSQEIEANVNVNFIVNVNVNVNLGVNVNVRAFRAWPYVHSFLYGVAKSTYWRRAKPQTFSLLEQIWHFLEHLALYKCFLALLSAYK